MIKMKIKLDEQKVKENGKYTFDLILKELKKNFGAKNYAKGYEELYKFFCIERDYEHRQRSVYCSNNPMSNKEALKTIINLTDNCPWMKSCLKRMDITNIGELHEVTNIITREIK